MRLFLVRHAASLSHDSADHALAISDTANMLSPRGHDQARALSAAFASLVNGADVRLVSSALPRATQTASAIAESIGQQLHIDSRLNELAISLPEGATERDNREAQLQAIRSPHKSIHGSERVADHRVRVSDWFAELCSAPKSDTYVVVSHGGTTEHLLSIVLGAPVEVMHTYFMGCSCAHFHCLSDFYPMPDWRVWRFEYINRSPSPLCHPPDAALSSDG